MLADALSAAGLEVPPLAGPHAEELKAQLLPGSSVGNPIDFLATGTAAHLGTILDYCNDRFENIDAMVVIFGTPGLVPIDDVYDLLHQKMAVSRKPVFPVLPSRGIARREVQEFVARGHVAFPDEVELGRALGRVTRTQRPGAMEPPPGLVDAEEAQRRVSGLRPGWLDGQSLRAVLKSAGIPLVPEASASRVEEIVPLARELGYPVALKVVGPLHKSDVGGVSLGCASDEEVRHEAERLLKIPGAVGVSVQPMVQGMELFAGSTHEPGFGHLVLCGLGGIFVEALGDVASGLAPLSHEEALFMIRSLRGHKVLSGLRGKEGVSEDAFADILTRLAALVHAVPWIEEVDLNPIMGVGRRLVVVDARLRLGERSRR